MQDFIHLHVHTHYSLLDGMSKVNEIVDKAIADGQRGIALTDHGNMFGMKELFDYCNSVNSKRAKEGLEPFKPIFGCEMYVARRDKENMSERIDRSGNHLIVLAKNANGYRNLIQLVSRAWVDGNYIRPRTDKKDLERFHEDLIICSACVAGEPQELIRRALRLEKYAMTESRSPEELFQMADDAVRWYKEVFGDDYYMELMRHEVKDPTVRANRDTYPVQKAVEPYLIKLAQKYNVKLVCSNDSHFLNKEDAEAHEILLCLSTGKKLSEDHMLYSKQEWLKTREEMNEVFADIPEALSNTIEILDKVETYDLDSAPIMPFYPIPEDFGTEEEWRTMFSEEHLFNEFTTDEYGKNAMPEDEGQKKIKRLGGYEKLYRIKFEGDYLGKLAYEGASRLYGTGYSLVEGKAMQPDDLSQWAAEHGIRQEVDERIRFELHIMKTMGFPGYFLIVQDFINSARKDLGVWVGPGRGSAAGSVVAYCLGITKLDPLKYDLLFERFLNPDRISLPDIDTDFDDDGRGKVLQWVMDKYGRDNCAHIITYGSMAAKNSIKDVARVEDIPLPKVNAWCKAMPDRLPDGMKSKLPNYLKVTKELQDAQASPIKEESDTISHALRLEGTVRNTGIHACGFIICRDPISEHVPVSTADDPDFPDIKTAVTQYDGHVIESTGLIKMDFLGLKTLSEQKECVKNIKLTRGIDVDLDTIPIDDPKTYELYQRGQTVGTFQFESAGMQKYLKELHPTVFEDLIAMNALYRPGPMDYIPSFIARKNGREPISYDIDCMEKYLKDTYGITVYQEQVMLLSRQLADFTRGESDALRKAMGKKKKDIVDKMKPKFIEGGKKNGHDPKILEKIWADWEKFASYAFNKSHAACYSWVAYQTAYLKANYPAEFMAALLTRRKSDIKEITKLMDECKNMKIATLGPDVNESFSDFGVNKKGEIRFGLAAIKGMGEAAAEAIISERNANGPYADIYDFAKRLNFSQVNRKAFESLALSGGFDSFGIQREQYFAVANTKGETFIETVVRFGQNYQNAMNEAKASLFGFEDMNMAIAIPQPPKNFVRWSQIEKLNKERELVGIYLSAHPLDDYSIVLKSMCNTQCVELANKEELTKKQEIVFGGIVTGVRTGISKRDKPFGIVTIEDYSGSGELALFDDWHMWSSKFIEGTPLYIKAKYTTRFANSTYYTLTIGSVEYMHDIKEKSIDRFTISVRSDKLTNELVEDLSEMINENKGDVPLFMQIFDVESGTSLLLQAKQTGIDVNHRITAFLDSKEEFNYFVN
ncbi:MAG: DNA polymerase III subunit alpha [Prevotellaceae bacterium]|nr:DNA polymerase III subunit alpha [Prevotellaceae bacterium]